jgi:UDP-glucose:glycoprotein glucosyltransferase
MQLLQRTYPGQIPPIKRDIFNLIVPVDLTKPEDVEVVAQLMNFVHRGLTVRFGIVPLTPTAAASDQAKVVYHLLQSYGLDAMATYLDAAVANMKVTAADKGLFGLTAEQNEVLADAIALTFEEVLLSESYAEQVKLANRWSSRLNANSAVPPVFMNGLAIPRDENWLQSMSMKLTADLQMVQQGVYMQTIKEDTWIPGEFLQKAVTRRNSYIYPEDDKSLKILDVNKIYTEHDDLFSQLPVLEAYAEATKENFAVLTVVADLDSQVGSQLFIDALKFRLNNPGVRLDVMHNPKSPNAKWSPNKLLQDSQGEFAEITPMLSQLEKAVTSGGYDQALASFVSAAQLERGAQVLIVNGRVIGPFNDENPFKEDDFQHLLEFEQLSRILPVYEAIDDLGLTEKLNSPLAAAMMTSITALSTISNLPEGIFESAPTLRTNAFDEWDSTHTTIEVGDVSAATIHFTGLLNPASEQGQKWAAILKILSELDGIYVKLFLNPKEKIEELPVKRFYRYVLQSAPSFDTAGKVESLWATFNGVPSEALLTAGMDVPPAWLVAPKVSIHDPDNIKLSSVKSNVEAVYELQNILIEGHSREPKGSAPRGAQLVLGTESNPHFADTIIMANLGYFQFKANPGYYNIKLKEGRSSDIYHIESIGAHGWAPVPGDEGADVALMDFQGTTLYPRLNRKAGKEKDDVLGEPEAADSDGGSIVSRGLKFAEGLLGGSGNGAKKRKSVSDEEHAEINIFSVASGHLYERMLNIMMVSVMRHTNHTVKFWFIEQFLSPSFKDFIPHMAKQYGFKYEMVTFKWPHWLRQQTEKQREIWGYKILFLDVLFPLSLDKVIFVDADQIVRTDMIELVNYNLDGAPYGFTPMCDSRTEMEGFRFWKQGYWANYLRGLPYHISALYVVDLHRFRELASGDRLRQQYHTLSADKNSLANLDQDLPNHMQFIIPIHSLPQEWLWCETWCSDESQKDAKTIDLCNNPQTKEPKLDRARRQVPEWTVYDDEIAALDRKRKGLPPLDVRGGGDGEAQKVVTAHDPAQVQKNTKSRNLEEPPAKETDNGKDEL